MKLQVIRCPVDKLIYIFRYHIGSMKKKLVNKTLCGSSTVSIVPKVCFFEEVVAAPTKLKRVLHYLPPTLILRTKNVMLIPDANVRRELLNARHDLHSIQNH